MHSRTIHQRTLPDAVENIALREDPDVNIGHQDVVESSLLFISEEGVWHPNFLGICHGQVFYPL